MRGNLRRAAFLLALLALWATVSSLGWVKPWLLPSPGAVGRSLVLGFRDGFGPRLCLPGLGERACARLGSVPYGVATSLSRLLIGYLVSLLGGIGLGLGLARSRQFRELVLPIVLGLQSLPSICWLPLAVIWFGLSDAAILFVVIVGSLLAISTATEASIRNVPPLLLRAAQTMGARGLTLQRRVVLPAALPGILTGMKLGWVFAWRSLMAGELIFVSGGIGQLLKTGQDTNDMARVLAVMTVIVALGLTIETLVFARLEARVRERWGYDRP